MEDISLVTATFTWDSANSHFGAPALRVTAAGRSGDFGAAEQLWPGMTAGDLVHLVLAETSDEDLLEIADDSSASGRRGRSFRTCRHGRIALGCHRTGGRQPQCREWASSCRLGTA